MSNVTETAAHAVLHVLDDSVDFARDYQGVTLWLGEDYPFHISDEMAAVDIAECVQAPVQRAVIAARLRAIADALSA